MRNRCASRWTGGWLSTRKYALLPIDARGIAQFDENDIHTDLAHALEIDVDIRFPPAESPSARRYNAEHAPLGIGDHDVGDLPELLSVANVDDHLLSEFLKAGFHISLYAPDLQIQTECDKNRMILGDLLPDTADGVLF